MLMSAFELLADNPGPTEEEVRTGMAGNLCMCTGYVNIVRSVLSAAAQMSQAADESPAYPKDAAR
jgi:carbon-monoxide dehydrogenase small subunit